MTPKHEITAPASSPSARAPGTVLSPDANRNGAFSESADKTPSPEVQALEALIQRILKNEVKVYRSVTGTDYLACSGELTFSASSLPLIDSPLSSDDALSWLTSFSFFECRSLLKAEAVMRMLPILKTRAMLRPVTNLHNTEALLVLESEPIVATVVEFLHINKQNPFETTMTDLYKQLKKFATEHGLLARGMKRFPGGSNVLGRQLRKFEGVLRALGVQVEVRRSDGSKVILTRLDETAKEPSADPSADNSNNSNDLSHEDGTSRILAALAARRIKEDSQSRESKK